MLSCVLLHSNSCTMASALFSFRPSGKCRTTQKFHFRAVNAGARPGWVGRVGWDWGGAGTPVPNPCSCPPLPSFLPSQWLCIVNHLCTMLLSPSCPRRRRRKTQLLLPSKRYPRLKPRSPEDGGCVLFLCPPPASSPLVCTPSTHFPSMAALLATM